MNEKQRELAKLVQEHFGVEVANWNEQEGFDASSITTIHEDNTKTVINRGYFTVHNFTSTDDDRYKLAEWNDEFPEDDELVTWMKHAEEATVKDYEQIAPRSLIKKYSLYKLIPYTVNGEPQW